MSTISQIILHSMFVIFSSLIHVAEADDSAPSTPDLVAPEITAITIPEKVYAGSELKIEITATDDVGVNSVLVFFRHKDADQYNKLEMNRASEANRYYVTIKNVPKAGVEFFVEAIDIAGNTIRNGQEFSPHSVVVLADFDLTIRNMKEGRLNNNDILTLFNNNTVEGHHIRKKFTFVRYYAADNRLVGINTKQGKRVGRWRVTKNSLCEQFEGPKESCQEIVKEGQTILKYVTNRNGERVVSIVYKRFRHGNHEGL